MKARRDAAGPRPAVRTPSGAVEGALVDAAEAVLVRDGAGAVTVRAVAAQAGVAPMGVYNHLGGKDGLLDALLVRGFEGLRAAIAPRGEVDPIERLRASGLRYREFALASREHYELMFGSRPQAEPSEALASAAAAAFGELVGHVEVAMAAGRVPSGDAFDVAQQVWSTVHGAVALELRGLVLTADPAQTYAGLLELVVRGVTSPDPAEG